MICPDCQFHCSCANQHSIVCRCYRLHKRGNMVCSECGFTCVCEGKHDELCRSIHRNVHTEWEQLEYDRDLESRKYSSSKELVPYQTPEIFDRPGWCLCCENRIIVTHHLCKAKDKSIEDVDFYLQLFVEGHNE